MSWFNGKRVIVPFDFSNECVNAVKLALELAERPDEVHVAHVLQQLPVTDPAVIWDGDIEENRKKVARSAMEKTLADNDIAGVQVNIALGKPGQVIADLADEIEAGLIVIPSHGYTGVQRFFLGSVAERVAQLATCPVLVLKTQGPA